MQKLSLNQNPIGQETGANSQALPATAEGLTNAQEKPSEAAGSKAESKPSETAKQVAAFKLEAYAAIEEGAAKLFDAQAERIEASAAELLKRIDDQAEQIGALRNECAAMARKQADSLRQVATTLRGTGET